MKNWESSLSSLASSLHEQISSQVGPQLWLSNVRAGVGAGSVIEVFRERHGVNAALGEQRAE